MNYINHFRIIVKISLILFVVFSSVALGRDLSVPAPIPVQKLNPSAEDLDKMMKKLLDTSLPSIEKKRITGILFYYQPIYRNAVSHGKFRANSPQVKAFLEQKKVMQADVIQRMGINYKNKYGVAPKQPVIPFDYNDIFSDDDIITGTGKTGRNLEPLYNKSLNEVMKETVGRPMDAATKKRVDVNGLAWNMTQDAAYLDFAHDEKYINPQSGYANQRKLIEGAKKGKVTVYTFDDNGKMIKLSPAESIEEIKRLAVGKTLDIPGIDATKGSGSMSDFLRMAEKHQIRIKGKVTVEQIQQFVRNQKYSQRVIGDYTDILEGDAKLNKQFQEFIALSNKLRSAKTIKAVASLLGSRYDEKILLPGGEVDYDKLTKVMMEHQNKQLNKVLPQMVAEVTKTEAYKIAKYLKTASKGNRLILRKQMALTYAPMTDANIEKIARQIDKMPDIDVENRRFIKSIIKGDSRQIRHYAELLQIPTDELATRLKIDGDNIACTKWISSTARYKPLMDAVTSRPGGSRFAAFLESKTAKALNLDIMLSKKAKRLPKFMLFSMMTLAATRAYSASGGGEEGVKAVANSMFEMIPFVASVLRFSEGEGKLAFKEFCMDVLPPLALANVAVMLGNYVAEEVKTSFTEDVKDGIAREVLRGLNDDDFIESDVPCYFMLKDREGMLQYLDDVSPGLGNIAKLASMIAPEIDALMSRHSEVEINNKAISTLQWFETISVGPYEAKFGKMFDFEQLKARVYETGVPAIDELPPVQRVAAKLIVDNMRIRKEMYHEVIKNFMDRIERLYNEKKEDCDEEWVQIVSATMVTVKDLYNNAPQKIKDSIFGSDKLKEEYRSIVKYLTAYDGEDKDLLELRKEMQEIIDQFREFIRKLGITVDIQREGRYIDLRGHIFGGNQRFDEGNEIMLGDRFRIGISARVSPVRKNLPWTVYYYTYNAKKEKIEKIASISLKPSKFNPGNEGLWLIENPEKTTFFEFDKQTSKKYFPEEQSYQVYPVIAFGKWSNPLAQVGYAALVNPANYPDLFSENRAAFIGPPIKFSMIRPTIHAEIKRYITKGESADLKIALYVPLYARDDGHKVEITSSSYVIDSKEPKVSPDLHDPVSTDSKNPLENPSISSVTFDDDAKEGSYAVTIKASIEELDKEDQPHSQTIILNYIDEFDKKPDNCKEKHLSKIESIEREIDAIKDFSDTSLSKCTAAKKVLVQLQEQMKLEKNTFPEIQSQINELVKRMTSAKKDKKVMEEYDKKIEKLATGIETISTELGELSLKICKKTETLNEYKIDDQEHEKTYRWIQKNKKELRNYLEKVKKRYKQIESYRNKITDILKEHKTVELEEIEMIEKSIQKMNTMSEKIDAAVSEAEEILLENLKSVSIIYSRKQAVKESLEKLSEKCGEELKDEIKALYERLSAISLSKCSRGIEAHIKNLKASSSRIKKEKIALTKKMSQAKKQHREYTRNIEIIKSLEKNRKTILLVVDNYLMRSKRFAVDGAFCAVLAKKIMKKVFIPNVVGMKFIDALSVLSKKGLNNVSEGKTKQILSKKLERRVYAQKPQNKKRVKKETKIILDHYSSYEDTVDNLMAQASCPSKFPGSENSWNASKKQIECICLGPILVWNKARTACIDQETAALEKADCSKYPGTVPGYKNGQLGCLCAGGLVPNGSNSACITQSQADLENANCQNGKVAILDYGVVKCQCPQRTWWVDSLGKCADSYEMAEDCNNRFPGSIPSNHSSGCSCPQGTTWVEGMNMCANSNQISQFCDQQFPGSIPQWDFQNNKQACGCPKGTKPQNNRCVSNQQQPVYVPPADIKRGECNSAHKAGGNEPQRFLFDLGGIASFKFQYKTLTAKDRILVFEGNRRIYDSGCVGTGLKWVTREIYKNPNVSQILIDVQPRCDGKKSSTRWYLKVICP